MPALAALLDRALHRGAARLEGPAERLDAAELDALAAAVADALRQRGIAASEPVHLAIGNRPRDLAAMLGIWRAGGVAVPVHVSTPDRVRGALQRRTGARFGVDGSAVEIVGTAPPPPRPLLADAALIVFTSGSTGEPKGVVIGHARLAGKLAALDRLLRLRVDDTVVLPLQLTFIFGIWVSLLTIITGAHLLLMPKFTGEDAHRALAAGATVLACVPTMLRTLTADATPSRTPRLILTGGEHLGASLARAVAAKFPAAALFDLYGLTETGSCDFCLGASDHPTGAGSIGAPTEGVAFRIADDGELQIDTPFRMLGYLDDPARTAAAYADGFFRTGDLARLRADGRVELIGRAKEIVSRAGQKIAPLEIDALFAEHPDVSAALSAGVPDPAVGERLHVLIVPRPGSAVGTEELRAWAALRIERYKLPDAIHLCEALPVGRTGKADRSAIVGWVRPEGPPTVFG